MLDLDETFTFRGQQVRWGALGRGDPVVLVHGFPWSAQSWRRIAPWLARRFRVYVFDMLGCGVSEQSAGQDVSPQVQSDLLLALLEHWRLASPRVVGHDFGGLAALRAHVLGGASYSRLCLLDAVGVLPSGSPFFRHVARHEAAFAGLPAVHHRALWSSYVAGTVVRPLSAQAHATYLAPWEGGTGQPAFYRQIAHANDEAVAQAQDAYAAADVETHLLWGEEDAFIPPAQGEQLAEEVRAASLSTVPGAGHLIQEDAPEAVVGWLLETL